VDLGRPVLVVLREGVKVRVEDGLDVGDLEGLIDGITVGVPRAFEVGSRVGVLLDGSLVGL